MWNVVERWVHRYFADEEAVLLSLLIVAALVVIVTMGTLLAPFLAALVFAFLLQSAVSLLKSWHFPHLLAVTIVFSCFMGFFFITMVFLFPIVIEQSSNLIQEVPGMIKRWQETILLLPEKYPNLISEARLAELVVYIQGETAQYAEAVLTFSVSKFPNVIVIMVYLVLVPLLIFFMLKDRDYLMGALADLLPQRRPVMNQVWREMNVQITNYVRGKATEVIAVGVTTYIWFSLLGVNYAALLAILVGLSVVIPYIGAAVVTIPVLLAGFFQWGWSGEFFWLVTAYTVIQTIDGNVLVPLLFSEAVNLHPVAIILAVLIFGGIWGIWGVFFAIPLATLVKALYNAWPRSVPEVLVSE
ncbi:MAG: AI-2E family transporter [Gammaproteobacteria bacterium]|nr:MAG: AI-2E family transporter [Gammaproteobacteria bacterium]RLA48596.1 MAG: AI-2E family transporter [Gammaproteobacteria bacterium]